MRDGKEGMKYIEDMMVKFGDDNHIDILKHKEIFTVTLNSRIVKLFIC